MQNSRALLKSPAETFKQFNERLGQAVKELLPTWARLYLTSGAPLVVLERDDSPVAALASVRVIPVAASTNEEAAKSQEILNRIASGNVSVSVVTGVDDYAFAIVTANEIVSKSAGAVDQVEAENSKKKLKPPRAVSMKGRG